MPERASVFQVPQIGLETVYGTSVAANKKLQSVSIALRPRTETEQFRPNGTLFPTVGAINKEWAEGSLEGQPVYAELPYLFASNIKAVAPTQMGGGTLAYQWVFAPASNSSNTVKSFTIEQGSAERAHKVTGALINSLGLTWSRNQGIDLSGSILAQRLTDGIALTPTPTALELLPVLPTEVSVYMADTQAGLAGASALTRCFKFEWELADRFTPVWTLDASQPSFATYVERAPSLTAKILLEADATGMGLLTQLRNQNTKWFRIKAVGPTIEATNTHLLQIDMPCKVADIDDLSDEDDVFAVSVSLAGVHDETWGKAVEVTVQNKLAAL